MYQDLYEKAKKIVKRKFMHEVYVMARPLHLETHPSTLGLGARLLKVRDCMNYRHDEVIDNTLLRLTVFASKSLMNTELCYSSLECEVLWILHGLEKLNHQCFMEEASIITDYKPLMAITSKDVPMLCQWLQHIMLRICQYRSHLLYKPGQE